MKIKIVNFRKFNPRNDLKSMPWLRLENNFYDLEDFFDADSNTSWLFIFLLCQCAQKVSDEINMSEKYLISKSKLKKSEFFNCLQFLQEKQLLTYSADGHERTRSDSLLTNERTNITNSTDVHGRTQKKPIKIKYDYEKIYSCYPRKEGKANGMKKLISHIDSEDSYNLIMQAVINYKNLVESRGTEKKFIKTFSSWVNQKCWDDEIEIVKTQEEIDEDIINKLGGLTYETRNSQVH